ncbi:hypothetical protein GCM10011387_23290 [Pedobacter quisquiliarum]|jgi:hypothetical protein|uniref:Uncharacterized protein n=2 Tax=Pedobacter quisquiliarum TaxID=1834438 RepID=A0A916UEA8_9SPHI|nr:hypothetical protein GCM10011387_23290 [Pedobacter quisquiliarum]
MQLMFKLVFINTSNKLYNLELKQTPSDYFIEKCKDAGYRVLCVIEDEVVKIKNPNITERFLQEFSYEQN